MEERVKATAEREKERKAESKVMLKQELKREFEGAKKPEGEQAEVEVRILKFGLFFGCQELYSYSC